jgi:hypothetical protein
MLLTFVSGVRLCALGTAKVLSSSCIGTVEERSSEASRVQAQAAPSDIDECSLCWQVASRSVFPKSNSGLLVRRCFAFGETFHRGMLCVTTMISVGGHDDSARDTFPHAGDLSIETPCSVDRRASSGRDRYWERKSHRAMTA